MSTNLIYCYSGTGNCLDMAKNIAKELGDTDIVMMRSAVHRRMSWSMPNISILLRRPTFSQ